MAKTGPKPNKSKERKFPERRCTGCGGTFLKKDLIRVVRAPEAKAADTEGTEVALQETAARVSVDFTGKKSGRGAYICPKSACFKKARRASRIQRSLEVEISEELYDALEHEVTVAEAEAADD